jgi:GTP-binding protein
VKISAEFVTSAAGAADLPRDDLAEIALVGRSNVGKSTLINALARTRVARTSAAPGKTRLANFYRLTRGSSAPFYLVDLPGFGYARGGDAATREFAELTRAYFGGEAGLPPAAVLLVDARHPGLASDIEAWRWLQSVVEDAAIVATKIDKLARGQRSRALRELDSVFEHSVLPVSAVTGEGLDELWKLIDKLANSRKPHPRSRDNPSRPPRAATARPHPRK